MTLCHRIACFAVFAMIVFPFTTREAAAAPFGFTKIILEVNATAGDAGIQISVDAAGWNGLVVSDPNRRQVFEVHGAGGVGETGVTELFFESAEPSFADLPLDQLLARFPEGRYTFDAEAVGGGALNGAATLTHAIPAGPVIVSPAAGAELNPAFPLVIDWEPVTAPFAGTHQPVSITGYQVIVERIKPQPLLVFSVFLPATVTQVTVSREFLEARAEYAFEVLAIETGGNQTITEGGFKTTR